MCYFLACLRETPIPKVYALLLICYPSLKQPEVEKPSSWYIIPYKGEGKPNKPPCVGDEIVVSLEGFDFVRKYQRNEKLVLR